jgi:hypothetical protein
MGSGEWKKGVPYSGEMNVDLFDVRAVGPAAESDFGGRVMAGGFSEVDRATGACTPGGMCGSEVTAQQAFAQDAAGDMGAGVQMGGRRRKTRRRQRGGRRSGSRSGRRSDRRSSGRRSSQKPFFLRLRLSGGVSLREKRH